MSKKKAYVIGTNVSTSMSPTIFQYWFDRYNIDYVEYGYKEIKEENFDKEIKSILKEDGLLGLNITIPYKEKIFTYIDNKHNLIHPTIPLKNPPINCVTIRKTSDPNYQGFKIFGENTDTTGFREALYTGATLDFYAHQDYCAIVLGYGGAAKATIHTLLSDSNFKRLIVFNRTFDKLKNLKEIFDNEIESYNIEDLPKHINSAQLIVNTTPTNMLGNLTKLDIDPNCVGFDIVYRPWEGTGFLKHFKKDNRIKGIHMLVHQAAPCFKEWFGIEPETDDAGLFRALYEKMNEK